MTTTSDFKIAWRGGLQWIESIALTRMPWLVHAFSTRLGGVSPCPVGPVGPSSTPQLNLGSVEWDRPENVSRNRQLFLSQVFPEQPGSTALAIAAIRQIHSAAVFQAFRETNDRIGYRSSSRAPFTAVPAPSPVLHQLSGCESANLRTGARPQSDSSSLQQASADVAPAGDALITDQPGILLTVRTADCMPILLVDPERRAIAAIHAGWRGALAGIIESTIFEMRQAFHSRPECIVAVVGPSIRACCYEVGEEVAAAFRESFPPYTRFETTDVPKPQARETLDLRHIRSQFTIPPVRDSETARPHLDLVAVARYELLAAGLRSSNVHVADFCTACRTDLFFSYRREGALAGRMMAAIVLK